jgi:aminoglycoside phosphotransferase (APT) family kinase protein
MSTTLTQPNAVPLPPRLIDSLLRAVSGQVDRSSPPDVVFHPQHSNDVAEMRFSDGQTLMVKRGRFAWAEPRFRASRMAARLLQEAAGVVAPAPLDLAPDIDTQPLEVYWRVELPTLQELWPTRSFRERESLLRSWGELVARVHGVRLQGHGPLADADGGISLETFLGADLGYRLFPAMSAEWPDGIPVLEELRSLVPVVTARAEGKGSTLLHNDLHMGNVLCDSVGGRFRCVGLIDLETAFAGPPEADLAMIEVHHGPLFSQPLAGRWFERVMDGYGGVLDAATRGFYRAYHMLNMGFYSALIGHREHAATVCASARRETAALLADEGLLLG